MKETTLMSSSYKTFDVPFEGDVLLTHSRSQTFTTILSYWLAGGHSNYKRQDCAFALRVKWLQATGSQSIPSLNSTLHAATTDGSCVVGYAIYVVAGSVGQGRKIFTVEMVGMRIFRVSLSASHGNKFNQSTSRLVHTPLSVQLAKTSSPYV